MKLDELLLRRLQAQYLLKPAKAVEVCRDICGLQSQFLRNAIHALRIRTDELRTEDLVKTWTLRGTVHLIPEADLPLYLRHCGTAEDVCRSGWYQWTAGRGQANPQEREITLARQMIEAIADGIDTREVLRVYMHSLGMTDVEAERVFNPWGGMVAELANIGAIAFCVDMPDATHPDETKRYRLLQPFMPMEESEAKLELARRYFTHYGPATLRDAAYFFHWTQGEIKELLPQLPVESAVCEGRTYYWVPVSTPNCDLPEVLLLAGFDPLMMGYRKEDNPFLPDEHLRGIFNLAGIVNPAILLRGRVVGKWKEKNGKVEFSAFESLSHQEKEKIADAAEALFDLKKVIWK